MIRFTWIRNSSRVLISKNRQTRRAGIHNPALLNSREELTSGLNGTANIGHLQIREFVSMKMDPLTALLPAEMTEMRYRPLFVFDIEVKPPKVIGATPGYDRRI